MNSRKADPSDGVCSDTWLPFTYNVKSAELKSDALKAEEEIEKLNDVQTLDADLGVKLLRREPAR